MRYGIRKSRIAHLAAKFHKLMHFDTSEKSNLKIWTLKIKINAPLTEQKNNKDFERNEICEERVDTTSQLHLTIQFQ